jgi:hypothetical protein
VRPSRRLTAWKGVTNALPDPPYTAGWALGPITATVFSLARSRGRRPSFLSRTRLFLAAESASSALAGSSLGAPTGGAGRSKDPAAKSARRMWPTFSSTALSGTRPEARSGAIFSRFRYLPEGISRSTPPARAPWVSWTASQSDITSPANPHARRSTSRVRKAEWEQ